MSVCHHLDEDGLIRSRIGAKNTAGRDIPGPPFSSQ
jgi:hypothetical protein